MDSITQMEVGPGLIVAVGASIVIQIALSISMYVAFIAYRDRALFLKYMAMASAMAAAGYVGYALTGRLPELIPILAGNGSFFAVAYFSTLGAAVASGRQSVGSAILAGLGAAILLLLLFSFVVPSFLVRNLVVTVSVAVSSAVSAVFLLHPRDETSRRITRIGASVYVAVAGFYVVRSALLIHALLVGGLSATLSNQTEIYLFLVALMLFVTLGLSFFTMMGGFLMVEREQSLKEISSLLRELQHRTKNNMALISSLVSIQEREVKDPAAIEVLTNLKARLGTVTNVYRLLGRVEDGHHADMRRYLTDLCEGISSSLISTTRNITLRLEAESHSLPSNKLVSVGLVVNELVTNALKHAFPDGRSGTILVTFSSEGEHYRIEVIDNGEGIDVGSARAGRDLDGESIGLTIIRSLVDQLEGELEITSQAGEGSRFTLRFRHNIPTTATGSVGRGK